MVHVQRSQLLHEVPPTWSPNPNPNPNPNPDPNPNECPPTAPARLGVRAAAG